MEIKRDNYVTLLGWMRTELDLTGSELIIYALVYMVSQADRQDYYATQQYAAEWSGISLRSVRNNINTLIEKGLVEKAIRCIDGNYITTYRVTNYRGVGNNRHSEEKSGTERKKLPTNIKNDFSISIPSICSLEDSDKDTKSIEQNIENTKNEDTTEFKANTKEDKISIKNKIIHLINAYTEDEELRTALIGFVEMRERVRKPVATEHAMVLLLKRLKSISNGKKTVAKEIVETSTMSGWLNFYEPKNNDGKKERGIYESDEEDETPIPGLW